MRSLVEIACGGEAGEAVSCAPTSTFTACQRCALHTACKAVMHFIQFWDN